MEWRAGGGAGAVGGRPDPGRPTVAGGSGLARRLWPGCRPELAVLAAGLLLAGLAWRFTTRPMPDSAGYRAAARALRDGWPTLQGRTPGYPLVLLLTGSAGGSRSTALFLVQLAMHAMSVVLVVDLARSVGVSRRGRLLLVLLLLAPPVLLRVALQATEATSALLVTAVLWLLAAPGLQRPVVRAVALGTLCGAVALVRPTFALLAVPVAVAAWWMLVPEGGVGVRRRRVAVAAAVLAPAVLLVGGFALSNAVRFDSPGVTPLFPYNLSSRTSTFVEELPESDEPARGVLVRTRDRALLRGEEFANEQFIWLAKDELSQVTGLRGVALDRYVLELDLRLISRHPLEYVAAVVTASTEYVAVDSQSALAPLGRPLLWSMALGHWVLLGAAALLACTVPGLWLVGRVGRRPAALMAAGLVLAAYTMAVSTMAEVGSARFRAPTEPVLALVLVVAASCLLPVLAERRRTAVG